jgi:hypothetical protein
VPKHRTQRRITRWEHEHVLETVQKRLDENPLTMGQMPETVSIRSWARNTS